MKSGFAARAKIGGVALVLLAAAGMAVAQSPVPSFSKAFSPSTIGPGSVSTLVFTINNQTSFGTRNLAFTDTLPAGVTIATPSVVANGCLGSVSAPAGGSTITFTGGELGANRSCTIRVNVTSSTPGTHTNVSGDLTSDLGNSGSATADLTVATDRPGFSKAFSPASVSLGGRSTLTFTIDNSLNPALAANLTFTDNLPAGMSVASPNNASTTCGGGVITAPAGGSSIFFAPAFFGDATVAASSTCTVKVDVVATGGGSLDNVSSDLTSTTQFGGTVRSSGKATARLTVTVDAITLVKSFVDDPVPPGGTVILRFTITNVNRSSTATAITFTDDLDATLSGLVATDLPKSNVCGTGSTLSGTGVITLAGGTLAPEASCTFTATLQVPTGAADGAYSNTTSDIRADVDGRQATGSPASDLLFVSSAPLITKTFLDDPVGAGGSTTIEFTITNTSPTDTATGIAFEDVFDVIFPTASATPGNDLCGLGSTSTFTPLVPVTSGSATPAKFSMAGGTLAAGDTCTFQLTLDVAVGAPVGTYVNTTSAVSATVGGEFLTGNAATDTVEVYPAPRLSKEFIDDPVNPGDTVTLRFTLRLSDLAQGDAVDIAFTDDLTATLSGLTAVSPTQTNVCGAGSEISGTTSLSFTGGTLAPGETCTFDVTLEVPSGAAIDSYPNTTSSVMATLLGEPVVGRAATDTLRIAGLDATKEFTDDPALAGGTVTLEFTLTNQSTTTSISGILFTDDLDATLDGLVAAAGSLPQSDVCGSGSSLTGSSGNSVVTLQNGVLGPGESCTFSVTLDVPSDAEADTYTNTTSDVRGTVGGETVFFDPASDELVIGTGFLTLMKEFIDDPVTPGDTVTLRFTLANAGAQTITDIAFTDDLDAALSGLAAVGLPISACGGTASGAGLITFTGGSLTGGEVCSFDVTVSVPGDAPVGLDPVNTTSQVTGSIGVLGVTGDPATDELQITFVGFSKSFDGPVVQGDTVVLTFSIQNLSASASLAELAFSDDLGAVLTGLVTTDLPQNDVCGPGSTLTGTSVIVLDGGNLLPGGSCTFAVTLQVPIDAEPGDYLNETSDLRQQGGALAAPPATAVLTVEELVIVDSDGDGVLDNLDVCPDTVIPEGVPTVRLGVNRWALVDDDGIFDTTLPNGNGPRLSFTIEDTAGCSCEQIIEAQGLGEGHVKFGCSISAMRDWVALVNP